jgi:hypothetical protein
MFKVKVKDIPVFYAGKRYVSGKELTIENEHMNDDLFDKIEEIENVPFKGVKEATLRKALEAAEIDIPEEADRDALIQLMNDNQVTL